MLFLISRINLNTEVFIQSITIFKEDYSNLKDFFKGAMGLQDQAFENSEK